MSCRTLALAAAAGALLWGGCGSRAVEIGALEPDPQLALARRSHRLTLRLGSATPDRIHLAAEGGLPLIRVRDFHRSLRRAFERGVAPAFAGEGSGAGQVLLLDVVGVDFVAEGTSTAAVAAGPPRIIPSHGGPTGMKRLHAPHAHRFARLEFSAALRAADGVELARASGHVVAAVAAGRSAEAIARSLAAAVEALYRRIASELLAVETASAQRARLRAGAFFLAAGFAAGAPSSAATSLRGAWAR